MRIGVDIDGVLNYDHQFHIECGTKYCAETGQGSLQDPCAHGLCQMFGWSQEVKNDFWDKYGKYQMCIWPAITSAAEVIQQLRADGHEVWIITGRNDRDRPIQGMLAPTWEETTKLWLQQNQIGYDEIHFDHQDLPGTSKGDFCAAHDVDIMIDDLPIYLSTITERTTPFLFYAPYNQDFTMPRMQRVYSWYDIYSKIKSMEQA